MLRTRWYKVLRELWQYKMRTLLVVISIAIGVFALGVILSTQFMTTRDLAISYQETNPAHATLLTFDSFDEDFLKSIRNMPEVAEAEARRGLYVRLQTGPDDWVILQLTAIPDYENMPIDKVKSVSGAWPPPEREMLIERSALGLTNAELGDTVHIKLPDGKEKDIRLAGLTYDLFAKLFVLDGVAYGYITADTLQWLGEPLDFNELRFTVAENTNDRAHIQAVADLVQDKLERDGRTVFFTFIPNPGEHPLNYILQAITILMVALGFLSLILSGFLVINTISALLGQQIRQIGIMKAVGARHNQIIMMYVVSVMIFGLLALLIAMPLGALGAQALTKYLADFFNFDITTNQIPGPVLVIEIAVALLVPIIAGLYPIVTGTRMTAQQALSDYGVNQIAFGTSGLDRWLVQPLAGGFRVTRPILLSLRNTFRRKKRLVLTLITLVLGGTIFMAVFSVQATLINTLDNWLAYFQYDVAIQFQRPYRIERLQREAFQVPGVVAAEGWGFYNTRRLRPDGSHSSNIYAFALPAETQLVKPTISEGRWLQADDGNAIVVNTIMLRDDPNVGVGDEISLKVEGRETAWHIVGIAQGGPFISTAFLNYPAFARTVGNKGRAEWLFVATETHSRTIQRNALRALEERFERLGFRIGATTIVSDERADAEAIFQVLIVLLFFMTAILAAVGSFGLMSTMSLNAMERTREIGIMRAVGASNGTIRRIFLTEGVLIGLLSWLIGLVFAWPISRLLTTAVGYQLINAPLDYSFSMEGVLIWLVTVVILAIISSLIPAWNASRLTVQEVLAYE